MLICITRDVITSTVKRKHNNSSSAPPWDRLGWPTLALWRDALELGLNSSLTRTHGCTCARCGGHGRGNARGKTFFWGESAHFHLWHAGVEVISCGPAPAYTAEWRFQLDFCLREMTKITHPFGTYKTLYLSACLDIDRCTPVCFLHNGWRAQIIHLCFTLQTHICHFSDELQLKEKRSRRAWLALSTVNAMHFVGSNKMYFSVWEVMLQCWWLERLS